MARLAAQSAQGRTSREIASTLFLSPKSLERLILHVHDKLGIRYRAELASRMAVHKDQ